VIWLFVLITATMLRRDASRPDTQGGLPMLIELFTVIRSAFTNFIMALFLFILTAPVALAAELL
jgi:hypothetical protein